MRFTIGRTQPAASVAIRRPTGARPISIISRPTSCSSGGASSLQSAFHLRQGFARITGGLLDADDMPIPTALARSGVGVLNQLGWLVPKIPLEFVARYSFVRNIYGAQSSQPDADEAGAGINYYFVGHNLKLQVDYFRTWDNSLGVSFADQARHGTDRLHVQVQLYF